jgi:hypothetical protein
LLPHVVHTVEVVVDVAALVRPGRRDGVGLYRLVLALGAQRAVTARKAVAIAAVVNILVVASRLSLVILDVVVLRRSGVHHVGRHERVSPLVLLALVPIRLLLDGPTFVSQMCYLLFVEAHLRESSLPLNLVLHWLILVAEQLTAGIGQWALLSCTTLHARQEAFHLQATFPVGLQIPAVERLLGLRHRMAHLEPPVICPLVVNCLHIIFAPILQPLLLLLLGLIRFHLGAVSLIAVPIQLILVLHLALFSALDDLGFDFAEDGLFLVFL